jgi:hypothetical protein
MDTVVNYIYNYTYYEPNNQLSEDEIRTDSTGVHDRCRFSVFSDQFSEFGFSVVR